MEFVRRLRSLCFSEADSFRPAFFQQILDHTPLMKEGDERFHKEHKSASTKMRDVLLPRRHPRRAPRDQQGFALRCLRKASLCLYQSPWRKTSAVVICPTLPRPQKILSLFKSR